MKLLKFPLPFSPNKAPQQEVESLDPLDPSSARSRQTKQEFADEATYLSYELGQAVQELPPLYTRLVAVSLSFAVFGAIGWAAFSKVDEVAVAPGELLPSEQIQPVRSLTNGGIQSIKVKEGQYVQKGDILIELDANQPTADVQRLGEQIKLMDMDLQRATGGVAGGQAARMQEAEIEGQRLRRSLIFAQREANSYCRLSGQGASPRMDCDRAQNKVSDLEKNIAAQQTKIQQLAEDYKGGNLSQLSQRREEREALRRQLDQAKDKQKGQKITAPISGNIYNINVTRSKGIVQTGDELLSILPSGKEPILQVDLPNQYRGFVDEGMKVKVKVDAFPYQEFGIIDGTVIYVSPNAVTKEKNAGQLGPQEKNFPTRVRLNKLSVMARGEDKPLTPGMSATGEIVLRQKTVLSFLLDPITRKFDEVFSIK
jgi:HlyD family secretion protein